MFIDLRFDIFFQLICEVQFFLSVFVCKYGLENLFEELIYRNIHRLVGFITIHKLLKYFFLIPVNMVMNLKEVK